MSAVAFTTTTGQHETVEDLIRYAARAFDAHGIAYPPAKMSKLIRREHRTHSNVRGLIDAYIDRAFRSLSWAGFELFTASGYADPTGARAVHNVDRERGSL